MFCGVVSEVRSAARGRDARGLDFCFLAKWDWPEPMTSYLALGWESTGTGADRRCDGGEGTRGRLLRTAIHYIDPDDVGSGTYLVVGMGILA